MAARKAYDLTLLFFCCCYCGCCCLARYVETTGFRRALSTSAKKYSKYERNKNNTDLTMISTQRRIFYFHCFPSFIFARMHGNESAVTTVSKSTDLCVSRKPKFFVCVGDQERLCTCVCLCICVGAASHCSSTSTRTADFFGLRELLNLFHNQR